MKKTQFGINLYRRISLIWVYILFDSVAVIAQDADPFSYHTIIQPSAAAYEMVRHGKINPSLYTGEMHYSLPIYTYQDPDFTIPVSLEYSYSGYKPSNGSGLVGMGWNLNYGGLLTREVVGLPDEYANGSVKGFFRLAMTGDGIGIRDVISNGYFSQTNILCQTSPCLSPNNPLSVFFGSEPFVSAYTEYFNNPLNGPLFDTASDIYSFTLPDGTSGKFIIQSTGSIQVYDTNVPEGELSVEMAMFNLGEQKIWITTSDGHVYQFGGHWNCMDYSVSDRDESWNASTYLFSSLRLVSIIAPNGRIVHFSYDTNRTYDFSYIDDFYYGYSSVIGNPVPIDDYYFSIDQSIPAHYQCTVSPILDTVFVNGSKTIVFYYSDKLFDEFSSTAKSSVGINYEQLRNILGVSGYPFNKNNCLSSVAIYNSSGQLIDSIILSHTYTSADSGHSPKMFLSSVSGNAGTNSFLYHNASSLTQYPPTDCKATDHWGYWRGSGGELVFNSSTAGRQKETLYNFSDAPQRNPDSTFTEFGALQRITYPSGGYSLIEYEQNRVNKRININLTYGYRNSYFLEECQSFPVGGLRVHKITDYAGSYGDFLGVVSYDYGSSGILLKMPRYMIQARAHLSYAHTIPQTPQGQVGILYMNGFSNEGAARQHIKHHIGYSSVISSFGDGSSTEVFFGDYVQYPDVYLPDFFSLDLGEVYDKVFFSTDDAPNFDQFGFDNVSYEIKSATVSDVFRNAALLDYMVCDRSSLRGIPIMQKTKDDSGSIIRQSSYSYLQETLCYQKSLINCYSHFMAGRREFIQPRLNSSVTTEYLPGGGSLSDTTLYTYNNLGQQTVVEKRGFNGTVRRSRLRYEHESDTTAPRANISEAASTRIVPAGEGVQEYVTSLRHFEYDTDSARRHLPVLAVDYGNPTPWAVSADTTVGWYSPLAPDDSVVRRLSYDVKHRPDTLSMPGGAYVAFVWDTSGRYPLSREDNGPSMVSTYQWKDMVGLTKKTAPTLRSEWYSYDDKWRLAEVRRADSVKITAYDYHLWCEDSTAGPSYTKQTTWRTSNKNNRDIVYYDGLGYPIQKVRTSTQTQWGHIITPIRYDALRRDDAKSYLPYEARYSTYNSADSAAQSQYYKLEFGNSEIYPYAEKTYGTSPAGRLLSSRQPGKDYADSSKIVTYDYRTNSAEDSILDLQAVVDTSFKLKVGTGYLPAGRLLLTKATDEDGCTSEVFTDASGKTVLSRQRTGGQRLDTYRIYDLRDSLVCVLQPEGSATIQLGSSHALLPPVARNAADTIPTINAIPDNYAFLYAWDSRGRLVAKKCPGAKAEEYLYDDRGRTVLSRDGNLRDQGKWLYSEYDEYDALLKKSLIEVELGLDTLRHAVRGDIDSTVVDTRDTLTLWAFLLNGENQDVYCKTHMPSVGDSTFFEDGTECMPVDSVGTDSQTGVYYICLGTDRFYYTGNFILLPVGERTVTINADWLAILANAVTNSTLLEEHRYDRGDSPGIPQALDFMSVTGIVTAADTSSTRNLEVWQRQLMLPPGRTVPGDTTRYVERTFYYDVPGNLVQTVETNALGGISRTSTKYDYLGNATVSEEKHTRAGSATADVKRTSYAYDKHGRMSSEYVALNNMAITATDFDYDILGHLTWTWGQGEESEKALQEMYSYDIRGRLLTKEASRMIPYEPGPGGGGGGDEEEEEEEEDPEWVPVSLFQSWLRYNNPQKQADIRRWNGLISEIAHQRGDNGAIITNEYYYDGAGRLVDNQRYDGSSQTNKYTERDLSFDRNGNILTLKRFGTNIAAPQDNLAYTYEGNKLMQLNNATYQYDANGNMTVDERRHLLLSWNHLNLPATISNDEDEDATVNYTYLADGTKVLAHASGTSEGYAYLGTMVYKLNNGIWTLETTPFTGGRFVRNATGTFIEQRHITDHLGSTRTIVEGGDYIEVEQNDYYPFGKRIADNTLPTISTNRWRFSGKEIQTLGGINLIDFGARLYDEDAVKWKSQDPMSESYLGLTPYGYCAGNPVNLIDLKGLDVYLFDENGKYLKKETKEGEHQLAICTKSDQNEVQYSYYKFADPENDPLAIDQGLIRQIQFIDEESIVSMLDNQGAFSASKQFFYQESKGGGRFDYSLSVLSNMYSTGSIEYEGGRGTMGNEPVSPFLFLPEGDGMVHNLMNFGNYLWGATGQAVGFKLNTLRVGAQYNSLLNSKTNSYSPQFDSPDDQRSISQGYYHAKRRKYESR